MGEVFGLIEDERGFGSSRFLKEMNERLEEALINTRELKVTSCNILENTEQIKEKQQKILSHFSETEYCIVSTIIQHYDDSQIRLVEEMLAMVKPEEIDLNHKEKRMAIEILKEISHRLDNIDKTQLANKEEFKIKLETEISTGAKLKLCVPIIPIILSVEGEIGLNAKIPLIKSIKDIYNAITKRK